METKKFLLLYTLFLGCTALTASEEERLILGSDTSLIDEKLRELPGGVLVPPEVGVGVVGLQFDRWGGGKKEPTTLRRQISTYSTSHHPTHSFSTPRHTPRDSPTTQNSPSVSLEIALKRIEILSSRAGFNMSALPRRTQLQLVKKILPKLPTKLQDPVKTALKNNSPKIFEFLPEPVRDPLIEDLPTFLSEVDIEDEPIESSVPMATTRDKQKDIISLTTDGISPSEMYGEEMSPPEMGSYSSNYERRVKWPSKTVKEPEIEKLPTAEPLKAVQSLENHEEIIEPQEKTIKISRSKSSKPIRVSIISKDSIKDSTTTTTTTTEKPTSTKYVQVSDFQNRTDLLFALDTQDSTDYSDLSSAEIEAMVTELERFEGNELGPHELEFPDHPEHPGNDEVNKDLEELERLKGRIDKEGLRRKPHPPPHLIRRPPPPPLQRPQRPPPQFRQPGRPLKINQVKVKEAPKEFDKECDYFSGEVCLLVQDYPIEAISDAIESSPSLASSLLPREDQESQNHTPPPQLSSEGGFLCPSKVAYGKIKKAKSSTSGRWKFVVNYGDKTQTLRLEKCLTPGDKCSYIMPHYRTACTQVYNYHRLLSWDSESGLHIDVFKIPTVCTCHVQGYYSPFNTPPTTSPIPQQPHPQHQQQQRRRMSHPPPYPRQPLPRSHNLKRGFPQQQNEELRDLLRQYALLRDKIDKKKATARSQNYEPLLQRKKRKNSTSPKPELKKLLKKLKNKNLTKKELISVAKRQMRNFGNLKKLRNSRNLKSRNGRNLKIKKSLKNKKLLKLLRALKVKKEKKQVNYDYHPIMEYIKK